MTLRFSQPIKKLTTTMGRLRQPLLSVLCLLFLAGMISIALPAIAQDRSVKELQQQQQQLDKQRSQLAKEQERLKNLEKAAQGNLQGLRQGIKATASQIKASETQLQTATKQLRSLEASLVKAEQLYQQKQFSTVARLRFLQRQQTD
ncbi:MAG TPA: peptidase M23, partial [Candidatus Sericytochromatia bacterium]